jgi:hypothetical protein
MKNFKVGDTVITNDKWNVNASSRGTVIKVEDYRVWMYWPDGLVFAGVVDDSLYHVPGYDEVAHSLGWSLTAAKHNLDIVSADPTGPRPGDRVRVLKPNGYDGCEGIVTYSVDDEGYPKVLITSDPWGKNMDTKYGRVAGNPPSANATGKVVSIQKKHLALLEPVEETSYHEAIDNLLPFV